MVGQQGLLCPSRSTCTYRTVAPSRESYCSAQSCRTIWHATALVGTLSGRLGGIGGRFAVEGRKLGIIPLKAFDHVIIRRKRCRLMQGSRSGVNRETLRYHSCSLFVFHVKCRLKVAWNWNNAVVVIDCPGQLITVRPRSKLCGKNMNTHYALEYAWFIPVPYVTP